LAAAEDAAIAKDLKATIALYGGTCDQVIDVKRNGDSDYLIACKDGNRYRVFVDAQGRVMVKKQ
jgi:Lon protease-like protein